MLEGIEKTSLTWRTLMDWVDAEIESARDHNESPAADGFETLRLRTRTATLREIKALTDQPKPPIPEGVAFDAR